MEDLDEIQGDLARFGSVLPRRYCELRKEEVSIGPNRRYYEEPFLAVHKEVDMTRKSTKNVSRGKGYALLRRPSGELTCSERQVDDVLSAGESTEEERRHVPARKNHPNKATARKE